MWWYVQPFSLDCLQLPLCIHNSPFETLQNPQSQVIEFWYIHTISYYTWCLHLFHVPLLYFYICPILFPQDSRHSHSPNSLAACLVKPTVKTGFRQILTIRFTFLGNQKPDGKEHLLYHHLSSWCFSPCSCHTWEICQPLGLHQPQGISLHSGHGWKSRLCYVACMRLRNRLVKVVSAARIRLLTWAAWTLTFHWFWHFLVVTRPSQTFSCYKIHSLLERHLRPSNLLLTMVKMNI